MSLHVALEGNLTAGALKTSLASIQKEIDQSSGPTNVIFDARQMTEYEISARTAFVDWHKRNKKKLRKIAIVTKNPLWRVVIHGMSLATGTNMKPFSDMSTAEAWFNE